MKTKRLVVPIMLFLFALAPLSAAHAQDAQPAGKPVALLYGKPVYLADIEPDATMVAQAQGQFQGNTLELWKADYRLNRLRQMIWAELQSQLLKEVNIEPTEEEMRLFSDFMQRTEKEQLNEFLAQRQAVAEKLNTKGLSENEQASLNNQAKVLDTLIAQTQRSQMENDANPEYARMKEDSMQQIARVTVASWKYNKALFNKYGGRVIFQQAGWEPIDAYKAFLEEHTKKKTFEVIDSAYQNVFDKMYEYFAMDHTYVDPKHAEQYFSKPWWDPAFQKM